MEVLSHGKSLLMKTGGYRASSHRAPTLWNTLPDDIRQVEHLHMFKS